MVLILFRFFQRYEEKKKLGKWEVEVGQREYNIVYNDLSQMGDDVSLYIGLNIIKIQRLKFEFGLMLNKEGILLVCY